mgnify:CR=1 FL=1
MNDLPLEITDTKVSFQWFPALPTQDEMNVYDTFTCKLCEMAQNQKRVSATEKPKDNEKEFQSGTSPLGVDNICLSVAANLAGAAIDSNNVLISASKDGGAPIAVGFRAKKANGEYRCFWLYRVKFGILATNLTTKGENIEFSTPSIEGTVMRCNKVDGKGNHPWKAEVSEDDTSVPASVISGWYTDVYEPEYTGSDS